MISLLYSCIQTCILFNVSLIFLLHSVLQSQDSLTRYYIFVELENCLKLALRVGEGNGTPLQYSCLENPMDRGAWWAAVYGVAQSRTRLKRLSSSSSIKSNLSCLVTQLCPTLYDPMDCSMPGFPVHDQLPELAQTHVHRAGVAIQPSYLLLSPCPTAFNLSPHQGLFQ